MAVPHRLRLTDPEQGFPPDVYRFDRRQTTRRRISGRATALLTARHGEEPANRRICSLQLHDLSDVGVGATSQEPIEPGVRVVVFFPDRGSQRGFDAYGEVIRCVGDAEGYHIGVRLDPPMQARAV